MADFDIPDIPNRPTFKEEMNEFDRMEKKANESYNAQFE